MRDDLLVEYTVLTEVLRENTIKLKLSDHHDARLQDSPAHIAEPRVTVDEHVKG